MLEKSAAFAAPGLSFERGSVEDFSAAAPFDLVFSNAALHFEGHEALWARLASFLAPGGQLAVHLPANQDHPTHVTARETAAEEPFVSALQGFALPTHVLPVEAYAMMGDFTEFSLVDAKKHGFRKVHLCAQWAKMVKIAMATPQTHVRFGALDINKAVEFVGAYCNTPLQGMDFNTAREIFDYLNVGARRAVPLQKVCNAAKDYAEGISEGVPVTAHLVS